MKRRREEVEEGTEHSIYPNGGKWVRGRLLGRGGFGSVHLATIKETGTRFTGFPPLMAVKSAYTSKAKELENEKHLLLECFADCPYIIRCYGDDITITQDNRQILNVFLEYASGGSLADLIKKAYYNHGMGLLQSQVKRYTESILRGIKCIHERGKVHCDLKPDNILLVEKDGDFVVKIADFGLMKKADDWYNLEDPKGTPMYFAPECASNICQEQFSDIWALGCVVLSMFTGRWPWDPLDRKELLQTIDTTSPVIPSDGSISKDAKDFLMQCFQRYPEDRPSAEMLLRHPFVCQPEIIDLTSEDEEDSCQEVHCEEEYKGEEFCYLTREDYLRLKRPAVSRKIFPIPHAFIDLTAEDEEVRPSAEILLRHPLVCQPEIIDLTSKDEEKEDPCQEVHCEEEYKREESCYLTREDYPRLKRPAVSRKIFPKSHTFTITGAA